MKVRMLSTAAGPHGVWPERSEQDLPEGVALSLIRGGHAVGLASASSAADNSAETAVVQPETSEAELPPDEQAILTPLEVAEVGRKRRKGR